jgi:nicotinamide mononucleotide transporter
MMSLAEAAGFALAVLMVVCSIKELHWSWPLAIASSVLYFFVFQDSQLYGEAVLQIVFAVLALWGWWQWLRPSLLKSQGSDIQRMSPRAGWQTAITALALWPLVAFFLQHLTDSDVPWWDGFVTALSLVGQYLLGRKYLENWLIWIVVNGVSIGLFAYKGLWLTVLLYVIFLVMSGVGWRTWLQKMKGPA